MSRFILPLSLIAAAVASTSTTSYPYAGSTLSDGVYVCNPAHGYPAANCSGDKPPATLSYLPATVTLSTVVVSTLKTVTSISASGGTCPLDLAGATFEFPHLIVWSDNGQNTSKTFYNGRISIRTTSYFNFDLPQSYSDKTCDVVFSLPRQDQLQTSSFILKGSGALTFNLLGSPAAENAAVPVVAAKLGSWEPVAGGSFVVATGRCASGQRLGYSITTDGDRFLDYFQDYNPCPIGLYIVAH